MRRNNHLKIGRYHQHLHELLDMDVSPIAYMMKKFPEELKEIDAVRKIIGRYGITGKAQVINNLGSCLEFFLRPFTAKGQFTRDAQ